MAPTANVFPGATDRAAQRRADRSGVTARLPIARRRTLRNADVLILIGAAVGLAIVSGTEPTDKLLDAFSFGRGNGGRILGLAVFAIFILFLLIVRALSQAGRNSRQLSAALEGLAWEEFRNAGLPERFAGRIGAPVPAYAKPRASATGWTGPGPGMRPRDRGPGR